MSESELWKEVVGYEGLYAVSNLGNVKSLRKNIIIKPIIANSGYERVDLWKHQNRKQVSVHRLVAKHFCDNPLNKKEVNHIDENKRNNRANNLEWVTHLENVRHGTGIKRKLESEGYKNRKFDSVKMSNIKSMPIIQYAKNGEFIAEWKSAKECSKILDISASNIREVCRGKRKTAGGYIFKDKGGK